MPPELREALLVIEKLIGEIDHGMHERDLYQLEVDVYALAKGFRYLCEQVQVLQASVDDLEGTVL